MKSFFAILLSALFCSCSATPTKREPKKLAPHAEQEYRAADALAKRGETKKAIPRLKRFVAQNPDSEATANAYFTMAQTYQNSQAYSEALVNFQAILNMPVSTPLEGEATIRAAKMQLKLGQPADAEKTLERLQRVRGLSNEQSLDADRTRFEALTAQKKDLRALESLIHLADKSAQPAERDKYRTQAIDSIDSRFHDDDLQEIAGSDRYSFVRPMAKFRYGVSLAEQKQYARAREVLSNVTELAPGSELASRADHLIAQIDARYRVDVHTIGVVLPLTGRQASIGYKALHGVQLGLGLLNRPGSGKKPSGLRLAVIDSEGNPDVARRAVEQLVQEDNVIGMIGGLLSKTATAEASKAQELGVPMVLLTQKSGATRVGEFIFRNSLTSQMQVEKLVDTAIDKLGMRNFAILFPNDAYGVEFANLFWDEVRAHGGEILGAQPYDPQETDFRSHVQRLVGTYYFEDRADEYKLRARAWSEKNPKRSARAQSPAPEELLPPIVDFDAIFIPDSAKAVGQIAPMLAYNNVNGVRLLGTNIWNSPSLISRGQKFVEDAVFVDSYLATDASFLGSDFYTTFKAAFEDEPGLTEVQAFDSATILRRLLAEGASSRSLLRDRLTGVQGFPGAVGRLSVSDEREILRPLTALTIRDGHVAALNASRR